MASPVWIRLCALLRAKKLMFLFVTGRLTVFRLLRDRLLHAKFHHIGAGLDVRLQNWRFYPISEYNARRGVSRFYEIFIVCGKYRGQLNIRIRRLV